MTYYHWLGAEADDLAAELSTLLPDRPITITKTARGRSVAIGDDYSLFITDGEPVSAANIATGYKYRKGVEADGWITQWPRVA